MQSATSFMGMFGTGAAIGGFFGGFIGAKIYHINRAFLPCFMGLTLASSGMYFIDALLFSSYQYFIIYFFLLW